jgi:cell shape-determining protein MreC
LDRLKELNADRSKLGDLRARCTPADVIAGDSGSLESLQLSSGSVSGLRDDMPVLCPDGIVGRLTKVGITSSRVKLITDKGSKVTVSFVRFEKDNTGVTKMSNVTYPDSVAEGQGERQLLVTHQRLHDLKDLKPNDWAVLNDPDWPRLSYRVGRVVAVEPQKDAPSQFGQIRIESVVDLNLLREVMVLTK